jgi:hypothetical protein
MATKYWLGRLILNHTSDFLKLLEKSLKQPEIELEI